MLIMDWEGVGKTRECYVKECIVTYAWMYW
jgi:hypothetical protein